RRRCRHLCLGRAPRHGPCHHPHRPGPHRRGRGRSLRPDVAAPPAGLDQEPGGPPPQERSAPMTATARIGIVTVSGRASAGIYADEGGPAIHDYFAKALISPWEPVARIIPDDRKLIAQTLIELADAQGCCLIVTTGGTGPAPRDVTPEATEDVIEKPMPGFG